MKKSITINLVLDTERMTIEEMDMVEGLYNRTEFMVGGDMSTSITTALRLIREELVYLLDD